MEKLIRVIVNPAAGQDEPALKVFNRVFREAGYRWDMRITLESGDAKKLSREAVKDGASIVVAYGGDGSVMEVAAGLIGTNVPLGIIPGGTGNVFSIEMGIPRDSEAACSLIVAPHASLRSVDVGKVGDIYFMERAGVGMEAAVARAADREAKNKYGIFAYIISTFQYLAEPEIVQYHLNIDGADIYCEGLGCIVANSGSLGVGKLVIAADINVSDGFLDVFIVDKTDLTTLISMAASVIEKNDLHGNLPHWKGKNISIEAAPDQLVHADGELIGKSPIDIQLLEHAVNVIVPPSGEYNPMLPAGVLQNRENPVLLDPSVPF